MTQAKTQANSWHTAELFGDPYPGETPQKQEDWANAAPDTSAAPNAGRTMYHVTDYPDGELTGLEARSAYGGYQEGVHLTADPRSHVDAGYGQCVYEVDTSGLPLLPSDHWDEAYYVPHDIEPSRLRRVAGPAVSSFPMLADTDPAMWYRINGEDVDLASLPMKGGKPIYVHQGTAYVGSDHPGLVEWAGDSGLKLAEYPGGGEMVDKKRHQEDLEMFNRGDTDWQPPRDNPDAEPRGPFACSECDYKPRDLADYRMHVEYEHTPHEEEIQDGHFPQIEDFDAPLPLRRNQPKPNGGETVAHLSHFDVIKLPDDRACYSIPQFETYSKLAGFDTPSTVYYGAFDDGELVGYGVVRERAPLRPTSDVQTLTWQPGGWGRGFIDPEGTLHSWNVNDLGARGTPHHRDYATALNLSHYENPIIIGPNGWYTHNTDTVNQDVTRFAVAHPMMKYTPDFGKWDRRTSAVHEPDDVEVMMIQAKEHGRGVGTAILRRIKRDYSRFYTHADSFAGERLMRREGMVNVKGHLWRYAQGKDPKDMLEASVPFVYDIGKDQLVLGYPGYDTHDVTSPQGFTPAGIVEGTYEPGGKVTIWTASTMPWTVRHLMDLWKAQAPQMEVTSVEAKELDGSMTKLAGVEPLTVYRGFPAGMHSAEALDALHRDPSQLLRRRKLGIHWTTDPTVAQTFAYGTGIPQHVWKWRQDANSWPAGLIVEAQVDPQHVVQPGSAEWESMADRYKIRPPDYGGENEVTIRRNAPISIQNLHVLTPDLTQPPQGGFASLPRHNVVPYGDNPRTAGYETQAVGPYMNALVQSEPAAANAYGALSAKGGEVYVVGGAVRDYMQGKTPKDVDLLVRGLPGEEVMHALRQLPGGVNLTGKRFGVYRYHAGDPQQDVEIALPRTDKYEGGNRAKAEITVNHELPVEKDLERRDFTANAMAVRLDDGTLVDPFNGAHDIQRGVLRTTNPNSFHEDPTRLVRALTAYSRFGLVPDERTRLEMRKYAHMLQHESPDTLSKVVDKWMGAGNPAAGVRLAHETGVLKYLFPEVDDHWDFDQRNPYHNLPLGEHLVHTLDNVSRLTSDPDVRLAALLHDIGKPASQWIDDNGVGHYYRVDNKETGESKGQYHESVGSQMADALMRRRFNWPSARTTRISELVRRHMFPPFNDEVGARKFMNKHNVYADDLLHLREADQMGKGQTPEEIQSRTQANEMRGLVEQQREMGAPVQQAAMAINGNDILSLGLKPGPAVGQVLQYLTNAVVENPEINTREQLLPLAQQQIDALPLETRATA